MRDAMRDPQAPHIDPVAEPACCPGGACGPIFDTPLLELAFNRIRDFVRSWSSTAVAEVTAPDPRVAKGRVTASAVAAPPSQPQKDAPCE